MKRTYVNGKTILELDSAGEASSIQTGLTDLLTKYQALASTIPGHPNPDDPYEAVWWAEQIREIEKMLKEI
jgi:hypothetical protein